MYVKDENELKTEQEIRVKALEVTDQTVVGRDEKAFSIC